MNFITATIKVSRHTEVVKAYGLDYLTAEAEITGTSGKGATKLRLLNYNGGEKGEVFQGPCARQDHTDHRSDHLS